MLQNLKFMAIVLTGNPGVGKHTLSEKIAKSQNLTILDLNETAIQNKIVEPSKETLDVDVKKLQNIIKEKISKDTLVVGHLAPYVLAKRQAETVIVLRKNPYKLDSIYRKRKYSKQKRIENQASEILGIIAHDSIKKFGYKKIIQIDTSKRSIRETVNVINNALSGHRVEDVIDWLALVYAKQDTERFFPTN